MNATYFDVAALLDLEGSFGASGVDLFSGEWGSPGKQVLVMEGIGTPSTLPNSYEQAGVQILVRGGKRESDHSVYLRAKAISDYLLSLSDCVTINATVYKGFEESSNIAMLGKDENERFVYSMNFVTWRNRT